MDAVKVVLISTLVQTLLACLHLQIQLIYYIEEQRRRSARRVAFLLQLSLPRRMYIAQHRRRRRFWIQPGRTAVWWANFEKEVVLPEEWHENFRCCVHNVIFLNGGGEIFVSLNTLQCVNVA